MPPKPSPPTLAARYPNVNSWVLGGGWVEIGQDRYGGSFARALDEGGQIWEGKQKYRTLDAALQALEKGIAAWIKENGWSG